MADRTGNDCSVLYERARRAHEEAETLQIDARRVRAQAKEVAARIFDRAMRAAGRPNESVADSFGLRESRLRSFRSDDPKDLDACPSTADLLMADPALYQHWQREIEAERLRLHGQPQFVGVEYQANATVHAAGAMLCEVSAARHSTGAIQPTSAPVILSALRTLQIAVERFGTLLRDMERR